MFFFRTINNIKPPPDKNISAKHFNSRHVPPRLNSSIPQKKNKKKKQNIVKLFIITPRPLMIHHNTLAFLRPDNRYFSAFTRLKKGAPLPDFATKTFPPPSRSPVRYLLHMQHIFFFFCFLLSDVPLTTRLRIERERERSVPARIQLNQSVWQSSRVGNCSTSRDFLTYFCWTWARKNARPAGTSLERVIYF